VIKYDSRKKVEPTLNSSLSCSRKKWQILDNTSLIFDVIGRYLKSLDRHFGNFKID
jgi:hypothetical protein